MMIVLGIDIDGTLADSVSPVVESLNISLGTSIMISSVRNYYLTKVFSGVSHEEVLKRFSDAWVDWEDMALVDNSIPRIMNMLSERFKIYITTASVGNGKNIQAWLEMNKIHFDEYIQVSHADEKSEQEVDIFIDDFHEVAEMAVSSGKRAILLKQPWNADFLDKNQDRRIMEAHSWDSIERILRFL